MASVSPPPPPPLRLVVHGTMHASTTTFSRYIADVDKDCLYWFEPDKNSLPPPVWLGAYGSILRCDARGEDWGGNWSGFVLQQRSQQLSHKFQTCGRPPLHGGPTAGSYLRQHCSQSWDVECVPLGSGCQNYCRSKRCVSLKSIRIDGSVGMLLQALQPLRNAGIVTVYRDMRGVVSSLARTDFLRSTGRIGRFTDLATWLESSADGTREERAAELFTWAQGRAHKTCPRLSRDMADADAWFKSHSSPRYVRVNSQEFIGRGTAEVRLADEVRVALGMSPLAQAHLRLPNLQLASSAAALGPGRARDSSWDSVSAMIGPRFEEMVRTECADLLFADQPWRIHIFGAQLQRPGTARAI
jgi:hypothetical protein